MPGIRFVLNDEQINLENISPTATLLDWLRESKKLTGTKEGCGEGDCGACTVLIGELDEGRLVYRSVNACIRFVASLSATHVVTVEHLAGDNGVLHPLQQALADCHGSQCGFCTPGIVMSLYALMMQNPAPSRPDIEKALQGNLCRCTGYESIFRAVETATKAIATAAPDRLARMREDVIAKLYASMPTTTVRMTSERQDTVIPATVEDLAQVLAAEPLAVIVAGATDVGLWVTKQMRKLSPVVFVNHLHELRKITEKDGALIIGAGATYSKAENAIAALYPVFGELIERIGGQQVRNMGTIGGNIANGSPIGDTPPALIALGAVLHLRAAGGVRSLPLEDFFIEYGKQDRNPGEFVEAVEIPRQPEEGRFAVYKISKRRDEDISALLGAFNLNLDASGVVKSIRIVFGGMAGTPKRATRTEAQLTGRPWTEEAVNAARACLAEDYQPLTDWRATSAYRMLAAQNLLTRFYLETAGETVSLRRYATLEVAE